MLYAPSSAVVQLLPDLAVLERLAMVDKTIVGSGCSRGFKRLKFSNDVPTSGPSQVHLINKQ